MKTARALPRGRVAALAVLAASGLGGCGMPHDDGWSYGSTDSLGPTNVLRMDIDTGAALTTDPGKGTGVLVEYQGGGVWHVVTECDTTQSGYTCYWDLVVSVDPDLDLEVTDQSTVDDDDAVLRVDRGSVRLAFETGEDLDGVRLLTRPGEVMRVDAMLDGVHDGSYVSWVGRGTVHTGAPSNPIDLEPTAP